MSQENQKEEIQIAVGIYLDNGSLAQLWLSEDGLRAPRITADDCITLIAILRDAADSLEQHKARLAN